MIFLSLLFIFSLFGSTFAAEPIAKKPALNGFIVFENKPLTSQEESLFKDFFKSQDDLGFLEDFSAEQKKDYFDIECEKIYQDPEHTNLAGMTFFQPRGEGLFIYYLMVNKTAQKQGYGKHMIVRLFEEYSPTVISLYSNGSLSGDNFYKSLDFKPSEDEDEEDLLVKKNPLV